MQLLKAFYAFYRALLERECEHNRIDSRAGGRKTAGFCPDCGYQVRVLWTLCRCRTCGSKRHPKMEPDGRVRPLYRYCQHCGEHDYQLVRKERLNIHEVPYAILSKEIDYTETSIQPVKARAHYAKNPFEIYGGLNQGLNHGFNIVEGEVLHSEILQADRK